MRDMETRLKARHVSAIFAVTMVTVQGVHGGENGMATTEYAKSKSTASVTFDTNAQLAAHRNSTSSKYQPKHDHNQSADASGVVRNGGDNEAYSAKKPDAPAANGEDQDTEQIKPTPVDQGVLLATHSASGHVPVKSWKTLRDTDIVKQDLDYSCGAASAATLLNSFYEQKISEKSFLKAMGVEDGMASFEDMAKAMPKFGFKAKGFAASWDQLVKLKIPVIVYVKYRKDDHFSVLKGISGDTVWLADPSLGNRTFSKSQFLEMWQTRKDKDAPELAGKFLAVLPAKADIDRMDNYFSKSPRRQSGAAVEQLSFRAGS